MQTNKPVAYVTGVRQFDPVMADTVLKVGTPLQWNSVRFNGGDVYSVYRFFCLLIQVRR